MTGMIPEPVGTAEDPRGEPRPRRRRKRRPAPMPRPNNTRSRLRFAFFSIAAMWGFIAGAAAILGAVSFMDLAFRPDGTTGTIVVLAALLAVAGGMVIARAYRDAVSNRR